jgi:hypothetical protein
MTLRKVGDEAPLGAPVDVHCDPPPYERQSNDSWCWAACVVMVLRHFSFPNPDNQCQVGQKGLGATCCTTDGVFIGGRGCVKTVDAPTIDALWDSYRRGMAIPFRQGIGCESLLSELEKCNVVELGFGGTSDLPGHVVLAYDWAMCEGLSGEQELWFYWHDPDGDGPGHKCKASMIFDNSTGLWVATWVLQR